MNQPENNPKNFFVSLLGVRRNWPNDMNEHESSIMQEHFLYLQKMVQEKKILIAGPVFDPVFGLIVLQVDSLEEANAIMKNDPSVISGIMTFDIAEMRASLVAENYPSSRYVEDQSDKHLIKEERINASVSEVWKSFTTSDGIKSFLRVNADIDLRIGGKYEIYFSMEPPVGQRGSEGCRVLSFLPEKMLSFDWNAPPHFGELRFTYTRVVIEFEEISAKETRVVLNHVGWGKSEKWNEVYNYFDNAWANVLAALKKSYE